MKVLHVAPSLAPEWGGPTAVIAGLTEALVKKGIKISVFAPSENGSGRCIKNNNGVDVKLFGKSFFSKFWTSYSSHLLKALKNEASGFDLIHIHELWHHPHFAAYKAAKYLNKPFVVTVHGMLEPWCLNHKALKKKLYSALIQKKILREAAALHAITEEEVENIGNYVDNDNIFLISNGINIEEFESLPDKGSFEDFYPEIKGKKILLFLGRLHTKKGLDILVKSFGSILKGRNDVHLVIAGPDSNGYKSKIVEMLKKYNGINNTTFTGMLTGSNKLAAFSRADIYVLSSYSEGFSISILEAMACGLPVVITKQCNFPEVERVGAGKVIDTDVAQLTGSLNELLGNPELCVDMGNRGKRLIKGKYTWDKVAEEMIAVYEEILKGNEVVA